MQKEIENRAASDNLKDILNARWYLEEVYMDVKAVFLFFFGKLVKKGLKTVLKTIRLGTVINFFTF